MTPLRLKLHAPSPPARRAAALAVPLLLVNGWAVYGQAAWAYDHLLPSRVAAVVFAATVESIAVYLAYEARTALLAGDSSFRLRVASYVAALAAGAMNYSHYAPAWDEPNAAALIFAVLSALSPWLWAIRTRSQRRGDLRAAGLVDARAAHFSAARWLHFPRRTWRALRRSIDASVQDPQSAWQAVKRPRGGLASAGSVGAVREEVTDAGGSGAEERPGPPAPDPLYMAAQALATHSGGRITRRELISGLRERGHKLGTKRADELLKQLRGHDAA